MRFPLKALALGAVVTVGVLLVRAFHQQNSPLEEKVSRVFQEFLSSDGSTRTYEGKRLSDGTVVIFELYKVPSGKTVRIQLVGEEIATVVKDHFNSILPSAISS